MHVGLGVLRHANPQERANIRTFIHCPASKTMEFVGDLYENLNRDDAGAMTPTMAEIDGNNPKSPVDGEEDDSSQATISEARDEFFESKSAVIEEANGTALRWIGKTVTNGNDGAVYAENALISVEEALALWKSFGEATSEEEPHPPCLDRAEALVGSTKITIKDNIPFDQTITGKYISVCQQQPDKNFEDVGMYRMISEDESHRGQMALASEQAPKVCCSDSMAPVSCEVLQTKPTPALITPTNEPDYSFPDMIRGTKNLFANTKLLQKEESFSTAIGRHDISQDIFSNEFSNEDHPGTLEHLLWDRLASLCEPVQLELPDETEKDNDIILGSTNESTTVTSGEA